MFFLAFLAAMSVVNAQSTLPVGIDPRCKRMDKNQWESFPKKESIRKLAFADLGIPADRPYTEVLFGHETITKFNENWFCAEGWNAVFEPARELRCNPSTVSLIDKSSNAPGTVTISVQSGTTTSTTLTETDSLEVAAGVSMTMSGSIPLVGKVETTVTFTQTYSKSFSKAQTFETSTATNIERAIEIGPSNSNCTASMTTTTCQHEATGKYPIIALGWVGWRLKDELTFNGEKARRWYVFIDQFPRAEREGWGQLNAGIASNTYATIISQCETSGATTSKRHARLARSDRMLRSWRTGRRAEIPANADELQTNEEKIARAKDSLPQNLKDKIISVGNSLIVPVADDE